MLGRPHGHGAGVAVLETRGDRVPGPQERPARGGLVDTVQLQRGVAARAAEPRPPLGIAVVAERARVGDHVHAVVAHLDRQRVGVPVGGDRQEPLGPVVAAHPHLGALAGRRAQEHDAGVAEARGAGRRTGTGDGRAPQHAGQDRGADVGVGQRRPPRQRAEHRRAGRQDRGPPVGLRIVDHEHEPVVAVALARRVQAHVDVAGQRVDHADDRVPQLGRHDAAGQVELGDAHERQLQRETVVLAGQLAVDAAGERLQGHLVGEQPQAQRAPLLGAPEPRERGGRHQQAGRFGHHVVVRRRARGVQRGEELLVVLDLAQRVRVLLEERWRTRPAVEQPADPGPRHEADAQLDAARPVHARQERVGLPPRAQVRGGALGVALVAGEPVGGRQHRQVVVARRLPHVLDVAHHRLVAVRDAERVRLLRGAHARGDVDEPVGIHVVGALQAEQLPVALHHPVGGVEQRLAGRRGHLVGQAGRQGPGEPGHGAGHRQRVDRADRHLTGGPALLHELVAGPVTDLARRHGPQPGHVPSGLHRTPGLMPSSAASPRCRWPRPRRPRSWRP